MRTPAQVFLDIDTNIKEARAGLAAMSLQLSRWKEFNEAAAIRLATASNLGVEAVNNAKKLVSARAL
jgi:hypothetical protein